jgi:hypothetical protein
MERCVTRRGLELAVDTAQGVLDDARMQDVILRAADKVRELQAAGVRVEERTETHTPTPR